MKARQIRQGDVLLESCEAAALKGLTKTRPTVALGEATGHHHSFEGKHTVGFYRADFFKAGDAEVGAPALAGGSIAGGGVALAEFIEVKGAPDSLTHQEHGPIELGAGAYKKTQQVEYEREQIRNVAD